MLGVACQLKGDRAAASQAYTEAISLSQAIGNNIITMEATIGLGNLQESDNQLYLAAQSYQSVLEMVGDLPLLVACKAYLGLAHILFEWNNLDAAEQYVQKCIQQAKQLENMDSFIDCEVFLARLKLAQGDGVGATVTLSSVGQYVRQHNFAYRLPEVASIQVLTLLHQGNLAAAAHLAQTHELPISQARVYLAQGHTSTALVILGHLRQQVEAKGWKDEWLKAMVLQTVALHAHGEKDKAVNLLGDALVLAEPGGFIRIFIDEGMPMFELLSEVAVHGIMPEYIGKLLAVFVAEEQKSVDKTDLHFVPFARGLIEPLSERELNVLELIAQGLSNREISERLFLALSSVKGHNQNIFGKLEVQRRTEAVARARELGLL